MRIIIFLTVNILLMSGCSSTGRVAYLYEDKNLPDNEVAKIVQSSQKSRWTPYINSYIKIEQPSDTDNEWVDLYDFFTGAPAELRVKPGKYVLLFHCTSGSTYAFPVGSVKAEAGKTYESRCFKAPNNKVGIEVKEINNSTQ